MNCVVLNRLCPICGKNTGILMRNINMYLPDGNPLPKEYQVVCCKNCGFAFADVKATQDIYNDYYKNYNMYSENEDIKANAWMSQVHQQRLNLFFNRVPREANILDVGCGGGDFLCYLKENGFKNLYGLDPSEKSIEKLKDKGIEGIWSNVFDEVEDKMRGSFDLVVSTAVVEHIYDLNTYIEQLKKYLREDGYLLLDAPAVEGFPKYIYPVPNYFNHEHINYFSIQSLDNLLDKHQMRRVNEKAYFTIGDKEQEKEITLLTLYHRGKQQGLIFDADSKISIEQYNDIIKNDINFTIDRIEKLNKKIIIWGSGSYAMQIIAEHKELLEHIDYFVDNNTIKQSMQICGKNVFAPSHLLQETEATILICSMKNSHDIEKQLSQMNTELEYYVL